MAGTNQTLSSLSTRFWIVAAREAILEWEKECAFCKIRKARNANQIMAPLPLNRLETSLKAFTKVAVDFGGPFITIQGRGRRREKCYLYIASGPLGDSLWTGCRFLYESLFSNDR